MTNLPNIKIIGLTGMSGAGKSTLCRLFRESGYLVIDCDLAARKVTEKGSPFLRELSQKLSRELIRPDGTLDRRKTAELIFGDEEKRAVYNKLIYPYIIYIVIEMIKRSDGDVLLDAPTLFEARLDMICTHILSVCADTDVCAKRIMKRDGISEQMARARLSSQHKAEYYKARSDFFIENNKDERQLYEAAGQIIERLKGGT